MNTCTKVDKRYNLIDAKFEPLDHFDMMALFKKMHEAEGVEKEKIREKLIYSNMRLALRLALRIFNNSSRNGCTVMDFIAVSNFALMRAVDFFKPDLGYHFSSYAQDAIASALYDFISQNDMIHASKMTMSYAYRYKKLKRDIPNISDEEACSILDITSTRLFLVKIVLNIKICHETSEDSLLLENLVDDSLPQYPFIENNDVKDYMYNIISRLEPIEQYTIMRIFLSGSCPNLNDIAIDVGRSREAIRRIYSKAMAKMKLYILEDYNSKKMVDINIGGMIKNEKTTKSKCTSVSELSLSHIKRYGSRKMAKISE